MSSILYDKNLDPYVYDARTETYVPADSDDPEAMDEQYSRWIKEKAEKAEYYVKGGIHYTKKVIYPKI